MILFLVEEPRALIKKIEIVRNIIKMYVNKIITDQSANDYFGAARMFLFIIRHDDLWTFALITLFAYAVERGGLGHRC